MGRRPGTRLRRASVVGVALYAAFLLTAPFGHTDHLVCPVKSTFHCTSCASGVLGSNLQTPTTLDGSHLADAGRAVTAVPLTHGIVLPARSIGRSPPAA